MDAVEFDEVELHGFAVGLGEEGGEAALVGGVEAGRRGAAGCCLGGHCGLYGRSWNERKELVVLADDEVGMLETKRCREIPELSRAHYRMYFA